jgi:hypothetical protein
VNVLVSVKPTGERAAVFVLHPEDVIAIVAGQSIHSTTDSAALLGVTAFVIAFAEGEAALMERIAKAGGTVEMVTSEPENPQ